MWTKLGDELPAAARDLSDAAFRTHTEALIWSNSRLLDLVIPRDDLRRFAESDEWLSAVDELLDRGWWQDCGSAGYFIGCKFGDWQLERSVVEKRREMAALRQQRKRRHDVGDHSLCTNCSAVTRDKPRDDTRDPGRDGTGRDPSTKRSQEQEDRRNGAAAANDRTSDAAAASNADATTNDTAASIAAAWNAGRRPSNWPAAVAYPPK